MGVPTNPTIFAAAISGSDAYDDQVHAMAVRNISVGEALRTITAADVRDGCDLLAPVAQRTGRDGWVSLEVAPDLAHDTILISNGPWLRRSGGRARVQGCSTTLRQPSDLSRKIIVAKAAS